MTEETKLEIGKHCRLKGLRAEELNSKIGLVVGLLPTGRYNVQLLDGKIVALKPENLEFSEAPGMFQPFRELLHQVKTQGAQKTFQEQMRLVTDIIPEELKPHLNYILLGFLAVFVVCSVWLGLFKSIVIIYTLFGLLVVGYSPFKSAGGGLRGLRNAELSLMKVLKEATERIFSRLLTDKQGHIGLAILTSLLFYWLFLTGGSVSPPSYLVDDKISSSLGLTGYPDTSKDLLRGAYEKGFIDSSSRIFNDDVNAGFEVFLKEISSTMAPKDLDAHLEPVSVSDSFGSALPTSSFFSITKILPLFIMAKVVFDLGKPVGSDSSLWNWDYKLAYQNFETQPLWKKTFIVFAVARVFM